MHAADASTRKGIPMTAENTAAMPGGDAVREGEACGERGPVLMCSGQGSQRAGMGADLFDEPDVAAAFSVASDVLGFDVAAACADGSDALADTRVAQPAIVALSIGIGRALMNRGVVPSAVLGFSLGQISALALSGMLDDRATFQMVGVRSSLMHDAAVAHPGAMSALLRMDASSVEALCDACAEGEVLVPANYNCPGQIVVSGSLAAIERAEAACAEQGGRAARLSTEGAFHSPLMADAARGFAAYLETVEFHEPSLPLICNVDARPLAAADARDHLVRHLVEPVRFEQSVRSLIETGARAFVEVGCGGVLEGLVKRIDRSCERACVQDRSSFDAYRARVMD